MILLAFICFLILVIVIYVLAECPTDAPCPNCGSTRKFTSKSRKGNHVYICVECGHLWV